MKKYYEKYEIWVEPMRENDSVSKNSSPSRKKSATGCSPILTKVVETVPPLAKPNGGTVEC